MKSKKKIERKKGAAVRVQRIVGWTNVRALSPRYHDTPRFPMEIYRTKAEAKLEFGLDAVRVVIVPANSEVSQPGQRPTNT